MANNEMLAVLTTLIPLGDRIDIAIDVDRRECNFNLLREQGWSSGEQALINWAQALWKGRGDVDLGYVANNLDGRFLAAALGGLVAYRSGRPLPTPAVLS